MIDFLPASLLATCTKTNSSKAVACLIFLSDLGDKIVIMEIIYYLLHVVIIGRGREILERED